MSHLWGQRDSSITWSAYFPFRSPGSAKSSPCTPPDAGLKPKPTKLLLLAFSSSLQVSGSSGLPRKRNLSGPTLSPALALASHATWYEGHCQMFDGHLIWGQSESRHEDALSAKCTADSPTLSTNRKNLKYLLTCFQH